MNKKNFFLGVLILLTATVILGGIQYNKSVQAEKMKKTEQKMSQSETIKQLVNKLFENDKKERLASDVTKEQIKDILQQIKELPSNISNEELLMDLNTAELFFEAQTKIPKLLKDTILSDNINKEQIEEAKKSLEKIEFISLTLHKELSLILAKADEQFKYNEETIKSLSDFFEDKNKEIVKRDVTKEQFEQIKVKIDAIKNKKIKDTQTKLLMRIQKQLMANEEETALEEQLLEEERLKEEAQQEEQDSVNGESDSTTNAVSEDYQSTWKQETPKPTQPWKPSGNKNPASEVKPAPSKPEVPKPAPSKPVIKPDVKPNPIPDSIPDSSTNEDPDKEPEATKEPDPIPPESSSESGEF